MAMERNPKNPWAPKKILKSWMNMDDLVLKCIEPIHLSDLGIHHSCHDLRKPHKWVKQPPVTDLHSWDDRPWENWGFDMIESSNIGIYNMIHISE